MSPVPNAAEATAIAVAIARFEADIAPAPAPAPAAEAVGPWQRAALVEGVGAKGTVRRHLEGGFEWPS